MLKIKTKNCMLFTLSLIAITSCATLYSTKEISQPQTVEVAVPVTAPKPPIIERPHLPISDLTTNSDSATIIKAYAATVQALKDYSLALEGYLEVYRR